MAIPHAEGYPKVGRDNASAVSQKIGREGWGWAQVGHQQGKRGRSCTEKEVMNLGTRVVMSWMPLLWVINGPVETYMVLLWGKFLQYIKMSA